MDFAKFVDLLQSRELFFSSALSLGDPFEGSVPYLMSKDFADEVVGSGLLDKIEIWPGVPNEVTLDVIEQTFDSRKHLCSSTYVSCWHMNSHESAAMWKLYSMSPESVCVQSRYSLLAEVLPEPVYVGVVEYIDYDEDEFDPTNTFIPFLHKRRSFEHEREARAVFQILRGVNDHPLASRLVGSGARIPIDTHRLIEKVFVNPISAPWFANVVSKIATQYGFSFEVRQSKLNQSPLY